MKIPYLLLTFIAGILASCHSDNPASEPHVVIYNDFESISGWAPEAQTVSLSRDRAHSGQYALKVGEGNAYSMSFDKPLRQVFDIRPQKIKVSAWALRSSPQATAAVVVTIDSVAARPGAKPLLWTTLDIAPAVKAANKWGKVSKVIEIPAAAGPESHLHIYLWSTNDQVVYLDDLVVRQE